MQLEADPTSPIQENEIQMISNPFHMERYRWYHFFLISFSQEEGWLVTSKEAALGDFQSSFFYFFSEHFSIY
jgi:hypothetical protein